METIEYMEERGLGGGQGGGRPTLGRTTAAGPKTDPAAPWQILDVILRLNFPSTRSVFWHGTTWVGKLISLAFRRRVERPNQSPYAAWASVFVRPCPAVRTELVNKLDSNVDWASNSIFSWALVICILAMFSSEFMGNGGAWVLESFFF